MSEQTQGSVCVSRLTTAHSLSFAPSCPHSHPESPEHLLTDGPSAFLLCAACISFSLSANRSADPMMRIRFCTSLPFKPCELCGRFLHPPSRVKGRIYGHRYKRLLFEPQLSLFSAYQLQHFSNIAEFPKLLIFYSSFHSLLLPLSASLLPTAERASLATQ